MMDESQAVAETTSGSAGSDPNRRDRLHRHVMQQADAIASKRAAQAAAAAGGDKIMASWLLLAWCQVDPKLADAALKIGIQRLARVGSQI